MADSIETLKELALLIRNATKTGENTAERVGRTLVGIIDYLNNEDITDFVTLDSEQEIIGLKHFAAGLSVGPGKHKLYEKDGVVYFEGDLAVTGGITQYATDGVSIPSIWEGIPFDNKTIWLNPETKKVEVIGGTGGDFDASAMWTALAGSTNEQINKSHLTTALSEYATTESVSTLQSEITKKWTQDDAKIKNWDTAFSWGNHASAGYAHLAGEETFTGLKHFTKNITIGAGKKSIYEKDGVVYIDADVAVKGGLTQYATDGIGVSTIMDGVTADEVTITKGSDNVLRIKNAGSGSSFDKAAMWAALAANTTEPIHKSHLTTALQGYATESWANSNFLGKTDKAVDSDKIDGEHNGNLTSRYWNPTSLVDDLNNYRHNGFAAWDTVSANKPYEYGTLFQFSNQGNPIAGTFDHWVNQLAYGTNNRLYVRQRINNTSSWTSWSSVAYLTDNVASATKLKNTRTIFGQNFNGEQNVNGLITSSISTNNIWNSIVKLSDTSLSDGHVITLNIGHSDSAKNNGYVGFGYYGSGDNRNILTFGLNRVDKVLNINGAGNIGIGTITPSYKLDVKGDIKADGWVRTSGNQGWYAQDWGGGWYMDDADWIKVYNNKSIYTGGKLQTLGDVEITGAGVFTTSNNTILRKKGYTNTDILRWDWNDSDGEHLKFTIPGTNNQSIYMKLTSRKGLVISGIMESNNINIVNTANAYFGAINSYNFAITGSDPDHKWTWYHAKSGDVQRGFTLWSYSYAGAANQVAAFISYGGNQFKMFGNILATGGITQYSDIRTKNIIEDVNIDLQQIANSPTIRFKWNGYKDRKDDGKTHVGGIAQYIQKILPEVIYNSNDLLTMDYATTGYIFSVNTAKHLLSYKTKTNKEINKLKSRVKYLEEKLKNLGYEEANIVDN